MNGWARLCALSGLAAASCAEPRMPAPSTAPGLFADEPGVTVSIGVARASITPPAGVSSFGYGAKARVTNGRWTQLYCRAFVLVASEQPLAIVPCDLPAIGSLLQRSVVAEVNRLGLALPASRVMLTATNTYAGPAHYLDGERLTGADSSELPGFDPAMLRFLSRSIAAAIHHAYQARRPGAVRWIHQAPELDVLELRVGAEGPADADGGAAPPEARCAAGSISFVATDAAPLPATNRLIGAGLFGVASRFVEGVHRLAPAAGCPADPLAGIVNAHQGDAAPRSQSIEQAIASGQRLGREITAALQSKTPFTSQPRLGARYVEVDLRSSSLLATGEEAIAKLTPVVPLSVVRVDDAAIAFVPTQLSAAAASQTKAAVRRAFTDAQDPVVPVLGGSTNGYVPASVLSNGQLARVASALSRNLLDGRAPLPAEPDRARAFDYSLGPERRRLPLGEGEATLYQARAQRRALELCTVEHAEPLAICFTWADVAPGAAPLVLGRSVGLEVAGGERSIWLDDRGTAFRTAAYGSAHDLWIWRTVVRPTVEQWQRLAAKGPLRIVTNIESGAVPVSAPFDHDHPPRDCSAEERRQCSM